LTRALRDRREVHLILRSEELLGGERVGLEELVDESVRHVQRRVRLDNRSLFTTIHTSKALFNTTELVGSEVAERKIDGIVLLPSKP
jgi:hypothetical protein